MGEIRGNALLRACVVVMLLGLSWAAPVRGQETPDDAAAREYFERGRTAFDQADYEGALVYFRHAYRLSRRSELQYNIGVAADRLQRQDEALEAFERYLEESENPEREAEVRERIHALRQSISQREATERALAEATSRQPTPSDGARFPTSAIAGSSALAAVGVAGVLAMGVGLARDGTCKGEVDGTCVTERSATGWTWVYGGIGAAALAGSAAWLGISARRGRTVRRAQVSVWAGGLAVRGAF